MVASETRPVLPPGMISGLLFFAVVISGSGYIIISKLNDFGALAVTSVPVLIMIGYAVLLGARLFRLRDDQAGDNLYYMGFLFTLTSLAVSLYQFSAAGSAEQIVQNFGIAIASTIAGITLRILFNQMRRDPVEVEATARMELAEASRRVKRELESVLLEFGYFRRMTQQSVTDALDEAQESIGQCAQGIFGRVEEAGSGDKQPVRSGSRRPSNARRPERTNRSGARREQAIGAGRRTARQKHRKDRRRHRQSFRQARLASNARSKSSRASWRP